MPPSGLRPLLEHAPVDGDHEAAFVDRVLVAFRAELVAHAVHVRPWPAAGFHMTEIDIKPGFSGGVEGAIRRMAAPGRRFVRSIDVTNHVRIVLSVHIFFILGDGFALPHREDDPVSASSRLLYPMGIYIPRLIRWASCQEVSLLNESAGWLLGQSVRDS